MKLLILGAGGHGQAVAELAQLTGKFEEIAFLDDNLSAHPDVIGVLDDYLKYQTMYDVAFAAFGNPCLRKKWQEKVAAAGYRLPILMHPTAMVSRSAVFGAGTVIMAKVVVQPHVRCGAGCILSACSIVDHDAQVGDYCHINAGAIVSALTEVPSETKVDYGTIWRKSN